MNIKSCSTYLLLFLILFCIGCRHNGSGSIKPVDIIRFDKELTDAFETQSDTALQEAFLKKYSGFLDIYCQGVLNLSPADSSYPVSGLKRFLSNQNIRQIYADTETKFADTKPIEKELGTLSKQIVQAFPDKSLPHIYTHVSGFNQSYIVTDSIISIALDNFLGKDYPPYTNTFYEYQLATKSPEYIIPGLAQVWLYSEFPHHHAPVETLLDNMIYEGKILYAAQQLLPDTPVEQILGYTPQQAEWLTQNEPVIWDRILTQQDLYSTNTITKSKYINPAPFTSTLIQEAPGRAGRWVGWRIVSTYMDENRHISLSQLLNDNDTDSQTILKLSKYKGK